MAGSISPYMTSKGKRYRVRYAKPDGKWTDKRGFKARADANLFLASVTVSKARGQYVDPRDGKQALSVFAERWKRTRLSGLKPSSQNAMETTWRLHVEPRWGDRPVSGIKQPEIEEWLTELAAKPLGAQSIRRAVAVLSSTLAVAHRDGVIPSIPTVGVKLPTKPKKHMRFLTHAQVDLLAACSSQPDLTLFLSYTGLRWGEASALKVKHLDFTRSRINIEDNLVVVKGEYITGTPKSGQSRAVPMPVFLVDTLRAIATTRPREAYVWGDGVTPLTYPNGSERWFGSAVKRAQAIDPTFPDITPHDCRHTAASLAVSAGANVKVVQRMLGHASAAMTLDVYAALFNDDLDAVAYRMAQSRTDATSAITGQNLVIREKAPHPDSDTSESSGALSEA